MKQSNFTEYFSKYPWDSSSEKVTVKNSFSTESETYLWPRSTSMMEPVAKIAHGFIHGFGSAKYHSKSKVINSVIFQWQY